MSFSIHVRGALHGWLTIEVTLGAELCSFDASDVYNNPLQELAELALFFASGARGARGVEFHIEPNHFELRAVYDEDLELQLVHVEDVARGVHQATRVAAERPAPIAAAREILRCLRAAQPLVSALSFDRARVWDEPFPELAVARLAAVFD